MAGDADDARLDATRGLYAGLRGGQAAHEDVALNGALQYPQAAANIRRERGTHDVPVDAPR